jgi:RNA polymerase sigma-70 factor (ECF subfamily)
MVRAYVAWDRVAVLERPAGWLYTTAFNLTRRRWRQRSRVPPSGLSRIEEPADRATVRLMLESALATLPGPQRKAVVLRYVLGFNTDEAAHILGVTSGALRALLHRAVVSLRLQPALSNTEESD